MILGMFLGVFAAFVVALFVAASDHKKEKVYKVFAVCAIIFIPIGGYLGSETDAYKAAIAADNSVIAKASGEALVKQIDFATKQVIVVTEQNRRLIVTMDEKNAALVGDKFTLTINKNGELALDKLTFDSQEK
jgi:hypothetical protein